MKTYCCVCGLNKETGQYVSKEEQEPCSSHGYCSECRECALENEYKCIQCESLHKGEYEDRRFCNWNSHVIYLEGEK